MVKLICSTTNPDFVKIVYDENNCGAMKGHIDDTNTVEVITNDFLGDIVVFDSVSWNFKSIVYSREENWEIAIDQDWNQVIDQDSVMRSI